MLKTFTLTNSGRPRKQGLLVRLIDKIAPLRDWLLSENWPWPPQDLDDECWWSRPLLLADGARIMICTVGMLRFGIAPSIDRKVKKVRLTISDTRGKGFGWMSMTCADDNRVALISIHPDAPRIKPYTFDLDIDIPMIMEAYGFPPQGVWWIRFEEIK